MQRLLRLLAIAASTTLALADGGCKQAANTAGKPSGNSIKTPGLNAQVPVGTPYDITWKADTPGTVSIVLLRGPSNNVVPFKCIADSVPNNGEYSWTPTDDLPNDSTHYGIQIIVDGSGQYQYSTQFGVSNPKHQGGSQLTSTTTAHGSNTVTNYHTVYHTPSTSAKNGTVSTKSHGTVASHRPSHKTTETREPTPTKPITKPTSLETSLAIETAPTEAAPTAEVTTTPTTSPTPGPNKSGADSINTPVVLAAVAGLVGAVFAFAL